MKDDSRSEAEEICLELSREGWEFTIIERDGLGTTVAIEHFDAQFGPLVTEFPPISLQAAMWYAAQIADSLDGP